MIKKNNKPNSLGLGSIRILLIDDDKLLRDSVSFFFRPTTSKFVAVDSAEKGIRELTNQDFDVVICDYRLPGMDGIGFFGNLSKMNIRVKKVLISAFVDAELRNKAIEVGVNCIIPKPFDLKEITKAILSFAAGSE